MQTQTLKCNNLATYFLYERIMLTIAENFGIFEGLSDYIDESYLKKTLVRNGSIAFFFDEYLEDVICLPYVSVSKLDVYNRPTKIQCFGFDGYVSRVLNVNEYVIMYDNEGRYPLFQDITQYAVRIANMMRTIDININQQKTPRFFKMSKEQELTCKNIMRKIDNNEDMFITFDNVPELSNFESVLAPAPYVSDKIRLQINELWNDFLTLVGIVNVNNEKKERMLTDEISFAQTKNIACINNRLQPRLKAIREIKKRFGIEYKFKYAGEGLVNELLYNDISDSFRFSSESSYT